MKSSHLLAIAIGFSLFASTGCKNKTESASHSSASAASLAQQQPAQNQSDHQKIDPNDPLHGTADALAQKTASYAKDMESLIKARTDGRPPEKPTDVKWTDPTPPEATGPVKIAPQAKTNGAPVVPAVDTAPPADNSNQALALAVDPKTQITKNPTVPAFDSTEHSAEKPRPVVNVNIDPSDALAKKLSQHVKEYPRDVAGQLDYQLLMLVNEQSVPQLDAFGSLPNEDREVVTALIDGLSNFRNAVRADNNMLLSRKIRPVLEMADRLRTQAELTIPTVALCTRVDSFGVYEPIEPARFSAGKEHPVIIYCEVGNFASQMTEKKKWQTQLVQEYTLFTETGMPVWSDKSKPITDLSRNRRHDFFLVKTAKLPGNLTIGRYLLKVTVVDQVASRVAEVTLPIEIGAE